jgi:hypothetical protein
MIKKLSFSYMLDTDKKILFKHEKEANLLWSRGGYPALNAKVLRDNYGKYDTIGIKTEKRKFWCSAKLARENHEKIQFQGYEPQIFVEPFFWNEDKLKQDDSKNV